MTLREVMGAGSEDVEIAALAADSRRVTPGALFFCVSGFRYDGHEFAADAVARGAAALVVERPLGLGVPEIVVPSAAPRWPARRSLRAAIRPRGWTSSA